LAEEKRTLEEIMEDYALKPVPPGYRNTWLSYLALAGIPQSMYYLAVGSLPVAMAGLWGGLTAAIIAGIGLGIIAWIFGTLSHRHGYSYDMLVRLYGWGHRGSILPSLISAALLVAFWVMEAYWMAKALEAAWPIPIWIYYIPLTILFILVPLYGYKVMGWFGTVTFPVGVLATFWAIFYFYGIEGFTFAQAGEMMAKPLIPGGFGGALDWSLLAIGLWGVALGNFGRFCGSRRSAGAAGPVMAALAHVFFPVLGILIVWPLIAKLTPVVGAEQAGMAAFDPSVPFVAALGGVGAIIVLAYQTSVQYQNVYIPSVNLSSIFAALFKWQPGRIWWVIVINAVGLIFLVAGAMGQMVNFASYAALALGVVTFTSIADWLYRRWGGYSQEFIFEKIRDVNPMAFVTFVVSCAVAIYFWKAGMVPSASIIGYPLSFLLYLGLSAATRGRYQRMLGEV
jgi:purine-cytosine permease-like protein